MPGTFEVPTLSDNPDGWGPTTVPEQLKSIPYAPFNKGDKIGRVADWTSQGYKYGQNRYDRERGVNAAFSFFHNEEEDSFHLVDTKPAPKPRYGPRRFQHHNRFQNRRDDGRGRDGARDTGGGADRERQRRERQQAQKRTQWQGNYYQDRNAPRVVYTSSVDIRPDWTVKEQIPLSALSKLSFEAPEPEELTSCGSLAFYDKSFDRVTPKTERPLARNEARNAPKLTPSDDPIMRRLAASGAGTVFASSSLLSTLMCAPRSVQPWDILIHRAPGGKLFLDQRDAGADRLTVNETAAITEAVPEEGINSVPSLSQEATALNQSFVQQVLQKGGSRVAFKEPNPFTPASASPPPSVAYLYRRWKLSEDVVLVARCELDCVVEMRGSNVNATVHALNEYDPRATNGVDWRQKLDNQRGAVLATELKNNANKLAKWTAQALMAGADLMKVGYVSRAIPRDNTRHAVLAVQAYKPKEFASQITLSTSNMWGILKSIVDLCLELDEGKYLLVRDANKPTMWLYEVPQDAFDDEYADEEAASADPSSAPAEGSSANVA